MLCNLLCRSNNTNKLSPQEPTGFSVGVGVGSNNTNKLSPQEHVQIRQVQCLRSNNTNKLSPQEPHFKHTRY